MFDEQGWRPSDPRRSGNWEDNPVLELAGDLLGRAASDETYPIPVVFVSPPGRYAVNDLAIGWSTNSTQRSDVPRKLAKRRLESEQVLPLLDGNHAASPPVFGGILSHLP